jgi:hypothetical protein
MLQETMNTRIRALHVLAAGIAQLVVPKVSGLYNCLTCHYVNLSPFSPSGIGINNKLLLK